MKDDFQLEANSYDFNDEDEADWNDDEENWNTEAEQADEPTDAKDESTAYLEFLNEEVTPGLLCFLSNPN